MTEARESLSSLTAARVVHGSLVTGVLLFAAVSSFVYKPTRPLAIDLTPGLHAGLLALCLGACALSLLLRRRVPIKSRDESSDAYWIAARQPAMLVWFPLEGASLLAIFLSASTHSMSAVAVSVVTVLLLATQTPGSLERR